MQNKISHANLIELLQQADNLKQRLNKQRDWDQPSVQEALNIEYTYDSNRIEGNTLTLRETDLVIHKGLTISGKPLNEHLEAINHYEAIGLIKDFVQDKTTFKKNMLLTIHALVLRGIDKDNAGIFRKVPVMISGSPHVPPQPWQVNPFMEDYFIFYETEKDKLHPIVLAAALHERLVSIHPFIDGNGRTARLVMNLILIQHGFPIAIIHGGIEQRLEYYRCLESCNVSTEGAEPNKEPATLDFHSFIARSVIESLERLLKLVKEKC